MTDPIQQYDDDVAILEMELHESLSKAFSQYLATAIHPEITKSMSDAFAELFRR